MLEIEQRQTALNKLGEKMAKEQDPDQVQLLHRKFKEEEAKLQVKSDDSFRQTNIVRSLESIVVPSSCLRKRFNCCLTVVNIVTQRTQF